MTKLTDLLLERVWPIILYALCTLILLYVILPMLAIVPLSFNAEPFFSYPIRKFSFRWY